MTLQSVSFLRNFSPLFLQGTHDVAAYRPTLRKNAGLNLNVVGHNCGGLAAIIQATKLLSVWCGAKLGRNPAVLG